MAAAGTRGGGDTVNGSSKQAHQNEDRKEGVPSAHVQRNWKGRTKTLDSLTSRKIKAINLGIG